VLGGEVLGPAERPWSWAPRPGVHRLQLVDAGGRVIDEVGFEVRGRLSGAGRGG
jgi:penicillin-binding protein 1C